MYDLIQIWNSLMKTGSANPAYLIKYRKQVQKGNQENLNQQNYTNKIIHTMSNLKMSNEVTNSKEGIRKCVDRSEISRQKFLFLKISDILDIWKQIRYNSTE